MEHAQADMEHLYYEVQGDISAKPKALCDLIEAAGRPKTIIYCNNPSDTDLVEVFLRRRGIPCEKLIGNVPPRRLQGVMKEVNAKEVCALVVTDIAANNLPVEDFELAISHSCPSDPEIYLHRIGDSNSSTNLQRSMSLVAPSDLTNFQYLKKIVSYDFRKEELPSDKELMKSKMTIVVGQALESTPAEEYSEAATELLAHEKKEQLVAFLLEKFFAEKEEERGSRRERPQRRRHDDEEPRDTGYDDDGDDSYEGRPARKTAVEMKRDSRFYIGLGSAQKQDSESLVTLLRSLGLPEDVEVERVSVRTNYSVIDVSEEHTDRVEDALKEAKLENGDSLHAYLATSISSPKKVDSTELESANDSSTDDNAQVDDSSDEAVGESAAAG